MRVIAQDGKIDIPYERMIIQIDFYDNKTIIAYDTVTLAADPLDMAKYSTTEKTIEAMEKLYRAYASGAKVFLFPQDDEIEEDEKND